MPTGDIANGQTAHLILLIKLAREPAFPIFKLLYASWNSNMMGS
jgi:hypothetical protein